MDELSEQAMSLVRELLCLSPEDRLTAAGALEHEWFRLQLPDTQSAVEPEPDPEPEPTRPRLFRVPTSPAVNYDAEPTAIAAQVHPPPRIAISTHGAPSNDYDDYDSDETNSFCNPVQEAVMKLQREQRTLTGSSLLVEPSLTPSSTPSIPPSSSDNLRDLGDRQSPPSPMLPPVRYSADGTRTGEALDIAANALPPWELAGKVQRRCTTCNISVVVAETHHASFLPNADKNVIQQGPTAVSGVSSHLKRMISIQLRCLL
jgi:serine/threonine protein kinase